jgi:hypothetical protein
MFIAEVLTRASEDLLSKWPATLLSGGETEINALIESRLNTLLDEDKLWSQLVRCVARGKETVSMTEATLKSSRTSQSTLRTELPLSLWLSSAN